MAVEGCIFQFHFQLVRGQNAPLSISFLLRVPVNISNIYIHVKHEKVSTYKMYIGNKLRKLFHFTQCYRTSQSLPFLSLVRRGSLCSHCSSHQHNLYQDLAARQQLPSPFRMYATATHRKQRCASKFCSMHKMSHGNMYVIFYTKRTLETSKRMSAQWIWSLGW